MASTRLPHLELAETVLVLPCSGKKTNFARTRDGNWDGDGDGASVLNCLPQPLAEELRARRTENAIAAKVDESTLLPAIERYVGHLYVAARPAFNRLSRSGTAVLIVSGGYGIVLARERIGTYDLAYRESLWSKELIGRCLAKYAESVRAKTVVGLLSETTQYAKTFRRAPWTGRRVFLITPERKAHGAMVKAPRAQGEALAAIIHGRHLPPNWESRDGLQMQVTQIC